VLLAGVAVLVAPLSQATLLASPTVTVRDRAGDDWATSTQEEVVLALSGSLGEGESEVSE
jgi:hypothetical protein